MLCSLRPPASGSRCTLSVQGELCSVRPVFPVLQRPVWLWGRVSHGAAFDRLRLEVSCWTDNHNKRFHGVPVCVHHNESLVHGLNHCHQFSFCLRLQYVMACHCHRPHLYLKFWYIAYCGIFAVVFLKICITIYLKSWLLMAFSISQICAQASVLLSSP